MKEILNHLFEHKKLTRKEAKEVLNNIALGKYSDSEIAAFLTVYIMRSISVEELQGFRDALLEHCIRVDLSDFNAIDVCGTGGDGKNTFNISTLTAFVVAGAGEKVAKHGNYGVSSACGSSNVLEHFGYRFTNDVDRLKKEIDTTGICFLHAPLFNPAMKNVAPVRKQLRVKTFFNMLGPLVNPSFPPMQLTGVFSLQLARLYHYLFQETDKKFMIIHSLDGYDEISLTGDFKMIDAFGENQISPEELGFRRLKEEELFGGDSVPEAASIFIDILNGKGSEAQNQAVIANTGMALHCIHPERSIEENMGKAKEALMSGKAFQVFDKLVSSDF